MFKLYIDYDAVAEKVGMTSMGVRTAMQSGRSSQENMKKIAEVFKMELTDLWYQDETPATIIMNKMWKKFEEENELT